VRGDRLTITEAELQAWFVRQPLPAEAALIDYGKNRLRNAVNLRNAYWSEPVIRKNIRC